jgi:hypothetical protein
MGLTKNIVLLSILGLLHGAACTNLRMQPDTLQVLDDVDNVLIKEMNVLDKEASQNTLTRGGGVGSFFSRDFQRAVSKEIESTKFHQRFAQATECGAAPGKIMDGAKFPSVETYKTAVEKAKANFKGKTPAEPAIDEILAALTNDGGYTTDHKGTKDCTSLQSCSKTGKAGDAAAVLKKLVEDAKATKPAFDKIATTLAAAFKTGEFVEASNKKEDRCMDKIKMKYSADKKYGVRELSDIVRGSIIFETEKDLCAALDAMQAMNTKGVLKIPGIADTVEVVNQKNRFKEPAAEYSDYLINIRINGAKNGGHVAELQLHHREMMKAKHDFHCVYKFTRKVSEAVTLMGMDIKTLDCKEYSQPLVDAVSDAKKLPIITKLIGQGLIINKAGKAWDAKKPDDIDIESSYQKLLDAMKKAYKTAADTKIFAGSGGDGCSKKKKLEEKEYDASFACA